MQTRVQFLGQLINAIRNDVIRGPVVPSVVCVFLIQKWLPIITSQNLNFPDMAFMAIPTSSSLTSPISFYVENLCGFYYNLLTISLGYLKVP